MDIPQELRDEVLGTAPVDETQVEEVEAEEPELVAESDGSQEEIAEEGAFDTLEQVLADAEWDADDFYSLKIKDPTSGDEVTLQEWKDQGTAA